MSLIERRKNEWKHAKPRQILSERRGGKDKPLHYFANNPPWNGYSFEPNKTNNKGSRRYISKNYKPLKNWNEHDKRQIDDFNSQKKELNT